MSLTISADKKRITLEKNGFKVENDCVNSTPFENFYDEWIEKLKHQLEEFKLKLKDVEKRKDRSVAFNYDEKDLKNEEWKQFPENPRYTVSNLGRIKYDGVILEQKDKYPDKTGWLILADKNRRQSTMIYNFVAFTFLNKKEGDGYQVHHVTNNGYDNSTNNLVLLTYNEHSYVHGFKIGKGE